MTPDQRARLEQLANPATFNLKREDKDVLRAALAEINAGKKVINAARKAASDGSNRHKLAPALAAYDKETQS